MIRSGPLTLGTAGHIDHGKTTLIHALTGINTDRLPEERVRGISIALGFAPLTTPAGRALSVVDVPGHERFVQTMVAGATGIDLFLMVIAADDGVMPQTVEHARILEALAVAYGVVAITKADLADPQPAIEQARDLFPQAEIVACSATRKEGLAEVLAAIDQMAAALPGRTSDHDAVLHIDRSFSMRGHGTVVTGTLWSGAISVGETYALLPTGRNVRVRGIEVHGTRMSEAVAGQRVAVNLAGIRSREIRRGDVLATPGAVRETTTLDCALNVNGVTPRQRVRVHHGTREALGRLVALDGDLWQLRLDDPIMAVDGDRVVIRQTTPPDTLGGGVVLDAQARRHGRDHAILDRLRRRRDGRPDPLPIPPVREEAPPSVPSAPALSPVQMAEIAQRLEHAGMQPVSAAQLGASPHLLRAMRDAGTIVRVDGELYMHARAVERARAHLIEVLQREGTITLAGARDELGVSRKSAQALLQHFDSTGLTRRMADDRRRLSPRHARAHDD